MRIEEFDNLYFWAHCVFFMHWDFVTSGMCFLTSNLILNSKRADLRFINGRNRRLNKINFYTSIPKFIISLFAFNWFHGFDFLIFPFGTFVIVSLILKWLWYRNYKLIIIIDEWALAGVSASNLIFVITSLYYIVIYLLKFFN